MALYPTAARSKLKISCRDEVLISQALALCQSGLRWRELSPFETETTRSPRIDPQLNWEIATSFLLLNVLSFLSFLPSCRPPPKGRRLCWEVGKRFADSLHVCVALFDLVKAYLIVKRDLFVFCDQGFVYKVALERKLI